MRLYETRRDDTDKMRWVKEGREGKRREEIGRDQKR